MTKEEFRRELARFLANYVEKNAWSWNHGTSALQAAQLLAFITIDELDRKKETAK